MYILNLALKTVLDWRSRSYRPLFEVAFDVWRRSLTFAGELWSWPIHMQKVKFKGHSVQKIDWKQTSGGDCIPPVNMTESEYYISSFSNNTVHCYKKKQDIARWNSTNPRRWQLDTGMPCSQAPRLALNEHTPPLPRNPYPLSWNIFIGWLITIQSD